MNIFKFAQEAGKKKRAEGDAAMAAAMEKELAKYGLLRDVTGFSLTLSEGVATLSGEVPDQARKEKMILAVGNVFTIKEVVDRLIVRPVVAAAPAPVTVAAPRKEVATIPASASTGPAAEATPEKPSTFHEVKKGDTLSAIAKAVYGKASLYPVIFEANRPMLKDPDKIFPGQILRCPPLA
jgi:nucleoid-associated protein YgaU